MRAISSWQPSASAIAVGAKRIETRHWSTTYRGPLAIHAARRKVVADLRFRHACWNWQGALRPLGWSWGETGASDIDNLPFGAIVAVCDLTDCRPTDGFTQADLDSPHRPPGETMHDYDWTERQMGNFDLGRYGWVLTNTRPLARPIPYRGRQGVFNVPDAIFVEVSK